jgi:hypothetical protein
MRLPRDHRLRYHLWQGLATAVDWPALIHSMDVLRGPPIRTPEDQPSAPRSTCSEPLLDTSILRVTSGARPYYILGLLHDGRSTLLPRALKDAYTDEVVALERLVDILVVEDGLYSYLRRGSPAGDDALLGPRCNGWSPLFLLYGTLRVISARQRKQRPAPTGALDYERALNSHVSHAIFSAYDHEQARRLCLLDQLVWPPRYPDSWVESTDRRRERVMARAGLRASAAGPVGIVCGAMHVPAIASFLLQEDYNPRLVTYHRYPPPVAALLKETIGFPQHCPVL